MDLSSVVDEIPTYISTAHRSLESEAPEVSMAAQRGMFKFF